MIGFSSFQTLTDERQLAIFRVLTSTGTADAPDLAEQRYPFLQGNVRRVGDVTQVRVLGMACLGERS
jgi:hypothetical protein